MRKKRTEFDTRVVTAYHEAGHAVASFVLHLRFEGVHIVADPGGKFLGRLYKKPETFRADWLEPREVDNQVIMALAGMAAEARLTGSADWSFGSDDFDFAFDIVAKLNDLADEDRVSRIKYLWELANNLLRRPGHWEAVEAVARELLLREDLSYEAVKATVTPLLRYKVALWRFRTSKPSSDPKVSRLRSSILHRLRPLSQDPSIQEAINLLNSVPVESSPDAEDPGAAD